MKKPYAAPAFEVFHLPSNEGDLKGGWLRNLDRDIALKLAVIIGSCDLLLMRETKLDQETAQRIRQIKVVAVHICEQLQKRSCPREIAEGEKAAVANRRQVSLNSQPLVV